MFKLYGKFNGNTELIDEADTKKEIQVLLIEYLIAFGPKWDIWTEEDKV